LGSGSIAEACWNRKFDLVGIEIDNEYFQKASKRLEAHKKQLTLF
jgi:DNA modification methylase